MKRADERMQAHNDNTVWTKRDKPPEDWNKPLPDFMVKRNEYSYLPLKVQELEEQERQAANPDQSGTVANTSVDNKLWKIESLCSIMWAGETARICRLLEMPSVGSVNKYNFKW